MFRKSELTKEEKKELKRKKKEARIKAKQKRGKRKKTDDNYYIIGGRFGDRDERTKGGIRTLYFRRFTFLLLALGIMMLVYQYAEMIDYKTNNSTPIGTELTFLKSEAPLTILDIWTDKKREVTVVKFKYSDKARQLLSTEGKNYNLHFLHTTKHKPKIEMKYGVLGTEGDGYLFIKGKLDKRAYQIYMANTLNMNYGDDKALPNISTIQKKSMEEMLSSVSEDTMNESGVITAIQSKFKNKEKEHKFDNINFRLNAYSDNTKVFDGTFLTDDNEIDYGKVIKQTSTVNVVKKIAKAIETLQQERQSYIVSLEEYQNRLKRDKKNSDAKENIEKINLRIEKLDTTLDALRKEKERYEKSEFRKEDFGNMQENFEYFDLQKGGYN